MSFIKNERESQLCELIPTCKRQGGTAGIDKERVYKIVPLSRSLMKRQKERVK